MGVASEVVELVDIKPIQLVSHDVKEERLFGAVVGVETGQESRANLLTDIAPSPLL